MHRFYIRPEHVSDRQLRLDQEQSRHIERVLRLRPGDAIIVFDGQGREYETKIVGAQDGQIIVEIIQLLLHDNESPLKLSLVQGIAKGDKMDFIIQKAVELGAYAVYPFFSQHAVVKLEQERAGKKQERWQTIAREACKQCRRNTIPAVHPLGSLSSMLNIINGQPAIMLYEKETRCGLKELLAEQRSVLSAARELFLIIGPEGGFSSSEAEAARAAGIMTAGLGSRILRTETAALAAMSIIFYELADLGSSSL